MLKTHFILTDSILGTEQRPKRQSQRQITTVKTNIIQFVFLEYAYDTFLRYTRNDGRFCHIVTQDSFRKRYLKNVGKEFV